MRSSISTWIRENEFERGELSGARLAALERLWAQAQEAAQLGHQVEHLKARDLEIADESNRDKSELVRFLCCSGCETPWRGARR